MPARVMRRSAPCPDSSYVSPSAGCLRRWLRPVRPAHHYTIGKGASLRSWADQEQFAPFAGARPVERWASGSSVSPSCTFLHAAAHWARRCGLSPSGIRCGPLKDGVAGDPSRCRAAHLVLVGLLRASPGVTTPIGARRASGLPGAVFPFGGSVAPPPRFWVTLLSVRPSPRRWWCADRRHLGSFSIPPGRVRPARFARVGCFRGLSLGACSSRWHCSQRARVTIAFWLSLAAPGRSRPGARWCAPARGRPAALRCPVVVAPCSSDHTGVARYSRQAMPVAGGAGH